MSTVHVIFLLALSFVTIGSAAAGISAEKSLVWGPGLDHNIHLPVHYVFIQAVDEDGTKCVGVRAERGAASPLSSSFV